MSEFRKYIQENPTNNEDLNKLNHVLNILDKTQDVLDKVVEKVLVMANLGYQFVGGNISEKQFLAAIDGSIEPAYADFLKHKYILKDIQSFDDGDWPMDDTETMKIMEDNKNESSSSNQG